MIFGVDTNNEVAACSAVNDTTSASLLSVTFTRSWAFTVTLCCTHPCPTVGVCGIPPLPITNHRATSDSKRTIRVETTIIHTGRADHRSSATGDSQITVRIQPISIRINLHNATINSDRGGRVLVRQAVVKRSIHPIISRMRGHSTIINSHIERLFSCGRNRVWLVISRTLSCISH